MKALFTILLCLVSAIASAEVFEHRYFDATFPDTDPEHFEVYEKDYVENIRYKNDSITLRIAVFPISIRVSKAKWIAQEMGCHFADSGETTEAYISGRHLERFCFCESETDSTPSYTKLYLLSNGEVTLAFSETVKDESVSWWTENINLKIEDLPTRSLSERTNDLENFFNRVLSDDGSKMKITEEEGHIKIEVAEQNPASADSGERGAMISVYRLIKIFSVFEEYANLGYLISIKICDGNGDVVSNRTFTPEEYLSWSDATFTEETVPEDMDGEEPETVVEVAVSIEPVNELIGIAYDGERYGLYNLARQKYLTEMSYRSLSLSVDGETDFGHAYCFKCIKEDGTESEVTVIKGPNYTIAITDSQ